MTRPGSRVALGLLAAALSLVAACESSPRIGFVDVDPSSSPPMEDPSFIGFTSPCPGFEPPREGFSCFEAWNHAMTNWDGRCEYGHDLDRSCNDVFECAQFWQRQARSECFGRCPEAIAEIVPGAPCDDVAVGCSYVEGTCACVPDPDEGDGGGAAPAAHWRCVPPPGNNCPAQRPSIGSDCVRPMTCDYGSCALRRELVYSCPGPGEWIQGDFPESCP